MNNDIFEPSGASISAASDLLKKRATEWRLINSSSEDSQACLMKLLSARDELAAWVEHYIDLGGSDDTLTEKAAEQLKFIDSRLNCWAQENDSFPTDRVGLIAQRRLLGPEAFSHDNYQIHRKYYKAVDKKDRQEMSEAIKALLTERHQFAVARGYENFASWRASTLELQSVDAIDHFLLQLEEAIKAVPKQQPEPNSAADKPAMGLQDFLEAFRHLAWRVFKVRINEIPEPGSVNGTVMWELRLGRGHEVIGHLGLDLLKRSGKYEGNWLQSLKTRSSEQLPLAVICMSLDAAELSGVQLTGSHARSLIHEFGHAFQHLLNPATEYLLAGVNFLTLDTLEVASISFETLLLEPEFSGRFENSRSKARADLIVRTVGLARVDHELHKAPLGDRCVEQVVKEILDSRLLQDQFSVADILEKRTFFEDDAYAGGYVSYVYGDAIACQIAGTNQAAPFLEKYLTIGNQKPLIELLPGLLGEKFEPRYLVEYLSGELTK